MTPFIYKCRWFYGITIRANGGSKQSIQGARGPLAHFKRKHQANFDLYTICSAGEELHRRRRIIERMGSNISKIQSQRERKGDFGKGSYPASRGRTVIFTCPFVYGAIIFLIVPFIVMGGILRVHFFTSI